MSETLDADSKSVADSKVATDDPVVQIDGLNIEDVDVKTHSEEHESPEEEVKKENIEESPEKGEEKEKEREEEKIPEEETSVQEEVEEEPRSDEALNAVELAEPTPVELDNIEFDNVELNPESNAFESNNVESNHESNVESNVESNAESNPESNPNNPESSAESNPVESNAELNTLETNGAEKGESKADSEQNTAASYSNIDSNIDSDTAERERVNDNEDDDEFGDFDEFEQYEEEQVEADSSTAAAVTQHLDMKSEEGVTDLNIPTPLTTSQIRSVSIDEIRAILQPPAGLSIDETEYDLGDGTTPTSQQLWQHLTEPSWIPLKRWEGSLIHKQLAVNLGIPQNLDTSLPKHELRQISLPIGSGDGFEGVESLKKMPEWSLLADVSVSALERMSTDEIEARVSVLSGALTEARALRDLMESREMDYMGEKNILEGMVESLLVFSQRNQRERLKHKLK